MSTKTREGRPIAERQSEQNCSERSCDSNLREHARTPFRVLNDTLPEIENTSSPASNFLGRVAASATTAQRGEVKYALTSDQYHNVMAAIAGRIEPDLYADSHVRTLYLDTSENTLIRRSIEKPAYKEKLRLRTYGAIRGLGDSCFLEIKKKASGVVYKRRVDMKLGDAVAFCRDGVYPAASLFSLDADEQKRVRQVIQEMAWMFSQYGPLRPSFTISYNRAAFKERETDALRITFDRDILWARQNDSFIPAVGDKELIRGNTCVMEIKAFPSMPLWLVDALNDCGIYPNSFSKAGSTFKAWIAQAGR